LSVGHALRLLRPHDRERHASVPESTRASVNLGTARPVRGRGLDPERLVAAVRESGYGAAPLDDADALEQEAAARRQTRDVLRRTLIAAALTVPVVVVSMADVMFPGNLVLRSP
jgi:Cu+-exporting ATPase